MSRVVYTFCIAVLVFFTQCESLKGLPTNTSGAYSLNGQWQLASTTDNRALEGTVVRVIPGYKDGTIRTLNNNTYCFRELDAIWRGLTGKEAGTFTMDMVVNACNETVVKPATITFSSNDEIRVVSRTAAGAELAQTWKRVNQ